jgi:hypothetical protein
LVCAIAATFAFDRFGSKLPQADDSVPDFGDTES